MKTVRHLKMWIGLLLCGSSLSVFALDAFEGFEELPWGANAEEIRASEKRHLKAKQSIPPHFSKYDPEAALVGMVLVAPASRLIYDGDGGEKVIYYLVGGQLTAVVHRPGTKYSFRPHRVLTELKKIYGDDVKQTKDIKYPTTWGRFDPEIEAPLTFDWDSPKGRTRVCTRVWNPLDLRQIFAVMYSSSEMNKKSEERMEMIDRARKQAEEEAKRLAEAKAAATATGTP